MTSLIVVLAILLGAIIFRGLHNWYSLRKAPGPFLAGTTDLWRAYMQYTGNLRKKLVQLHTQHGPIVRYGVNCISINDPEVINAVYGARGGFVLADSYKPLVGTANGKEIESLLTIQDEKKHAALRRGVSNAFTPNAVLDYEPLIAKSLTELLTFMDTKIGAGSFDLVSCLLYYGMDNAARVSFGETLGCIAKQADTTGVIGNIHTRIMHWGRWSALPQLERLIFRNPVMLRREGAPSRIIGMAAEIIKTKSERANDKPDLAQRFLEARKEDRLSGPGILAMLLSVISAAGDSTAGTSSAALYFLMKHPTCMEKLKLELASASLPTIPAYAEINKLPYLHAVIRETMRIFTGGNIPMERLVPEGGVSICGMSFSAGTSVGCLPAALHLNPAIYERPEEFWPERWLTEDEEQLKVMEACHMGFSRGRRACLGQHVAMLVMKKLISTLILRYQFSLKDPKDELSTEQKSALVILEPLYINLKNA